eukprot:537888_1
MVLIMDEQEDMLGEVIMDRIHCCNHEWDIWEKIISKSALNIIGLIDIIDAVNKIDKFRDECEAIKIDDIPPEIQKRFKRNRIIGKLLKENSTQLEILVSALEERNLIEYSFDLEFDLELSEYIGKAKTLVEFVDLKVTTNDVNLEECYVLIIGILKILKMKKM